MDFSNYLKALAYAEAFIFAFKTTPIMKETILKEETKNERNNKEDQGT